MDNSPRKISIFSFSHSISSSLLIRQQTKKKKIVFYCFESKVIKNVLAIIAYKHWILAIPFGLNNLFPFLNIYTDTLDTNRAIIRNLFELYIRFPYHSFLHESSHLLKKLCTGVICNLSRLPSFLSLTKMIFENQTVLFMDRILFAVILY